MPHLVLLGDSIFDNAAYTRGGPDVVAQVRNLLPRQWRASLLARDGALADDVAGQVARLPADATHLVLSVGGNDALGQIGILDLPAVSMAQAIALLADVAQEFAARYRPAVASALRAGLPLALCTIYEGWFGDRAYQRLAATALTHFNDVILRSAVEHGLAALDLRAICTHAENYANPIEPSSIGGEKIARAIAAWVTAPREIGGRSTGILRGA
jgi:hypothetical protein